MKKQSSASGVLAGIPAGQRSAPMRPAANTAEMLARALGLQQHGLLDEAAAVCKNILRVQPRNHNALALLGTMCLQRGNLEGGIRLICASLAIEPRQPDACNNLGNALRELKQPQEALAAYERAIALSPGFAEAYNNRGNVLRDLNRWHEALACYERAIALDPGNAEGYWNKSLVRLLTGDYAEGWQLYEWRWQGPFKTAARNFAQPLWLGEQPIAGKTVLLHAEQGPGDTLQFCRYAALVAAFGARVVIEAPSTLLPLLSSLAGNFTLVGKGQPLPAFDLHCPLMSLPLAFGTTLETIPADVPYLAADPDKIGEWRQRLGAKARPRVGLAWSGRATHNNDHNRSISLKRLAALLALPFEFHSLQKEIAPDDAAELPAFPQLILHRDELRDFSDTAALVQAMDLVIAVDTSVAHLAGALGKPLWLLLPFAPDCRWLLERNHSPWYPTAWLFRQSTIGDWGSVVEKVIGELELR